MLFMKKSLIQEKNYSFALNIIKLYQGLVHWNEYVISRQVLKSGTSIGANVEEVLAEQSRADFLSKCPLPQKRPEKQTIG